jgi:hypothetical protein
MVKKTAGQDDSTGQVCLNAGCAESGAAARNSRMTESRPSSLKESFLRPSSCSGQADQAKRIYENHAEKSTENTPKDPVTMYIRSVSNGI